MYVKLFDNLFYRSNNGSYREQRIKNTITLVLASREFRGITPCDHLTRFRECYQFYEKPPVVARFGLTVHTGSDATRFFVAQSVNPTRLLFLCLEEASCFYFPCYENTPSISCSFSFSRPACLLQAAILRPRSRSLYRELYRQSVPFCRSYLTRSRVRILSILRSARDIVRSLAGPYRRKSTILSFVLWTFFTDTDVQRIRYRESLKNFQMRTSVRYRRSWQCYSNSFVRPYIGLAFRRFS